MNDSMNDSTKNSPKDSKIPDSFDIYPNLRVDVTVEQMTHHITKIIQGNDSLREQIHKSIENAITEFDLDAIAKDMVNIQLHQMMRKMVEDHRVVAILQDYIIGHLRITLMDASVEIQQKTLMLSKEYRSMRSAIEKVISDNLGSKEKIKGNK